MTSSARLLRSKEDWGKPGSVKGEAFMKKRNGGTRSYNQKWQVQGPEKWKLAQRASAHHRIPLVARGIKWWWTITECSFQFIKLTTTSIFECFANHPFPPRGRADVRAVSPRALLSRVLPWEHHALIRATRKRKKSDIDQDRQEGTVICFKRDTGIKHNGH